MLTEAELRTVAMQIEDEFCHAYRCVTGGTYIGDLVLQDVLYRLLANEVIVPGPGFGD